MLMGYFFFVALLVGMFFWIKKASFFKFGTLPTTVSYVAFALKLLAGIALWLVYTYYYTDRINADIYKYFDDATHLFNATTSNLELRFRLIFGFQNDAAIASTLSDTQYWSSNSEVLFNDNRTLTRIHLALLHFSSGFYLFHVFLFSIISFLGSCGIFHFFRKQSSVPHWLLFAIAFLIPSVLFWATAPLKESLLLFGFGLFLYGLVEVRKQQTWQAIGTLTIGLLTLLSIKVYFFFALIPGLWFWSNSFRKSNPTKAGQTFRFLWIHLLTSLLLTSNKIIAIIANKQSQFNALVEKSNPNNIVKIDHFSSFFSLVAAIPKALYNVLVSPVFPSKWTPFTILSSAEHLLLLGILILPFIFRRKISISEHNLTLFCISVVLITSIIIGLTVPILGGIVRYKAPLIPFYMISIFTFVDISRIFKPRT